MEDAQLASDRVGCLLARRAIGQEFRRLLLLRPLADRPGRNSGDADASRHILQHHGIRPDARTAMDGERAQHLGAGTDDDVVLERRVALAAIERRAAERHTLIERYIVADLGGLANDDA